MQWKQQVLILTIELVVGFLLGRVFIPYFRKKKTGKFDFYIGDRFAKDGSEPRFGGIVIFLAFLLGLGIGVVSFKTDEMGNGYDSRVILAVIMFLFILLCTGLFEDFMRDTKAGIGMKPFYKWCIEFVVSFCFLVLVNLFGAGTTDVLMPFHLGYIHFGVLYYPLMSLFMTTVINCVEIHDCTNGVVETGVDGLCAFSVLLCSIGLSGGFIVGNVNEISKLLAVCTIGATAGFIFWNLSPSKIYLGQSGSLLLGGLVVTSCVLSQLHLIMVFTGIVFVIDGVCALMQRLVFLKTKKLLFGGASLHEHFKNKGFSDYKIMSISAIASVLGAVMTIAFVVYAKNLVL